jgi:uncharacterized protein (DUF488 family)
MIFLSARSIDFFHFLMPTTIYTIGYAGLTIHTFIEILHHFGIKQLVDVRRFPNSKTNPDYNQGLLRATISNSGLEYHWLGQQLGGFRDEGFSDYMLSDAYNAGLRKLVFLGELDRTAICCLERKYTDCHRRFIADSLVSEHWIVKHIVDKQTVVIHSIQTDLFHSPGEDT